MARYAKSSSAHRPPALVERVRQQFFYWIDQNSPPADTHRLSRRNLYIFPSARGFAFIGVFSLLWLLGTNYQNNLILALAFLLASLMVVAILDTHSNLAGVDVRLVGAEPAFAGELVELIFSLSCAKRGAAENLKFRWQGSDLTAIACVDPSQATLVRVPLQSRRRGWLIPGRLRVETTYPLGLLRCWTWLNWDLRALVYPAPLEVPEPLNNLSEGDVLGDYAVRGGEDFSGLTDYRPGDSLKNIAWKSLARERGLYVKEFSQSSSREIWLDLSGAQGVGLEQQLAGLCHWALEYDSRDEYYGLRLPGLELAPDKGESHKRLVLEALALFGDRSP